MPKFIHKVPVRIAWGDCDPAQIVFYPRYFAMFDNSTDQIFRAALGMPKKEWTKTFGFIGFPMVDTRAKFHVPTGYGDDVVIETQVTEFRSSSFDVVHRLMKGDKLAVEGWETRVLVGPDPDKPGGIKSKAIPPEILAAFDRA